MEKLKDTFVSPLWYEKFDVDNVQSSFQHFWHTSIYIAAIYLIVVYSSSKVVTKKHDTKWMLAVWNACLAIFSCWGAINVTWLLLVDLTTTGFDETVCNKGYYVHRKKLAYWLYLFCLSKVPELFDTAFIILRKAPLQILHTYHHATVLVFAWHIMAYGPGASYWYAAMNYLVHAIMYSYFCLRAVNIKIPQTLAKCITSLQSLQMLVGFSVNFYSMYRKWNGYECGNTYAHSIVAIALYFSYFVLFLQFANQKYSKDKSKAAQISAAETKIKAA